MSCLLAVVIFSGAPGLFPLACYNYHFSNAYLGFVFVFFKPNVIHFLVRPSPRVVFHGLAQVGTNSGVPFLWSVFSSFMEELSPQA